MENNIIWRRLEPKTKDEEQLKAAYELIKAKGLTREDVKLLLDNFKSNSERPTRLEIFIKLFPKADEIKANCPQIFDMQFKCPEHNKCSVCKGTYWHSEAEDGFGGFKMTEDERSNTNE